MRLALLAACLFLAAPAAAEIYRWTDEKGQEHFTMELHRVPAQYRGQAKKNQILEKAKADPDPAPINTMTTNDAAKTRRALSPRYSRGRHSAPAASASSRCASWQRSKAQKLEDKIRRYEQKVELYENQERKLVRLEDRLRAENNVERYELLLEQAEDEYERFRSDMRQRGVEPGCLR